MELTSDQLILQSLFKEFITKLVADASVYTGGPIRIKTDLHLGVGDIKQKDKAVEYAKVMSEIIQQVEIEQQGINKQGPTGILAQ